MPGHRTEESASSTLPTKRPNLTRTLDARVLLRFAREHPGRERAGKSGGAGTCRVLRKGCVADRAGYKGKAPRRRSKNAPVQARSYRCSDTYAASMADLRAPAGM